MESVVGLLHRFQNKSVILVLTVETQEFVLEPPAEEAIWVSFHNSKDHLTNTRPYS